MANAQKFFGFMLMLAAAGIVAIGYGTLPLPGICQAITANGGTVPCATQPAAGYFVSAALVLLLGILLVAFNRKGDSR
jgi:hypothetical protein